MVENNLHKKKQIERSYLVSPSGDMFTLKRSFNLTSLSN